MNRRNDAAVIGNQVFQTKGHGGRREGAGRKPGAFNRVTADIRAIAQPYGALAVAELARLAGLTDAPGAANEATRVVALRELLDRGFGRATQLIAGDASHSPIHYTFEWAPATPALPELQLDAADGNEASADEVSISWNAC